MMKQLKPDFYLVEELADKLRVNKMTIYRYIKAGRLAASKLGKHYRITRAEFERFIKATSTNNIPSSKENL